MKIVSFFILALLVCAGCVSRYDMRLSDGMIITAKGKPRVDEKNHIVYFKDATGKANTIPEFRVTEIAPHSTMSQEDETKPFKGVTKQ